MLHCLTKAPPSILQGGDDVGPGEGQVSGNLPLVQAILGLKVAEEERLPPVDSLLRINAGLGVWVDANDAAAGGAEDKGAV
ncbi:hypothetical protein O988_01626 [Pseudogymnoascus sp. VKM F-3808]|nr:hypothetical protein O988_01626 [Pseudogymnoascus sp. VKM F-3808]